LKGAILQDTKTDAYLLVEDISEESVMIRDGFVVSEMPRWQLDSLVQSKELRVIKGGQA
jgi:hypothetical protein